MSNGNGNGYAFREVRFAVLKRDKFTCQYCGRAGDTVALEVDHVIPKCKGGSSEPDNLMTSCMDCNAGKWGNSIKVPEHIKAQLVKKPKDKKTLKVVGCSSKILYEIFAERKVNIIPALTKEYTEKWNDFLDEAVEIKKISKAMRTDLYMVKKPSRNRGLPFEFLGVGKKMYLCGGRNILFSVFKRGRIVAMEKFFELEVELINIEGDIYEGQKIIDSRTLEYRTLIVAVIRETNYWLIRYMRKIETCTYEKPVLEEGVHFPDPSKSIISC